jgi:AcrR family transcriptional regulator
MGPSSPRTIRDMRVFGALELTGNARDGQNGNVDMPNESSAGRPRAGKPRTGGARGRKQAQGDPRSRLLAAMLEVVGEQGAAATTVADVIARAGASRKTFYEHFEDRQACFLVAGDEVSREWVDRARSAVGQAQGAREAIDAFVGALFAASLDSPPALRMIAAELTAVGTAGIARRERVLNELARMLGEALEGLAREDPDVGEGFRLPADDDGDDSPLARALTGAIVRMVYARARRGARVRRPRRMELLALVSDVARWTASYRFVREPRIAPFSREGAAPVGGRAPGMLSLDSRASERRGLPRGESSVSHSFVVHNQRERLLDALANLSAAKGYGEVTIPELVQEAAVSVQSFYEHFSGKEDAFLVAYELGQRKLLVIVERVFQSGADWEGGVRAATGTLLDFLASEPSFAHLALVDVLTAGPKADTLARDWEGRLAEMIRPRLDYSEDGGRRVELMAEGAVNALQELCYVYAASERAREMGALLDLATHVALAPFMGVGVAETEQRAGRSASRPPA